MRRTFGFWSRWSCPALLRLLNPPLVLAMSSSTANTSSPASHSLLLCLCHPSALSPLPAEDTDGSDVLRDLQLPATSGSEDPLSPLPVSETVTSPRPSDSSGLPWLLAPWSPLCPVIPLAPLSLWLHLGQSSTFLRYRIPHLRPQLILLALSGSSFPPAPPRSSRSLPLPQLPEPSAQPWPFGTSVSPWLCSSPSPP